MHDPEVLIIGAGPTGTMLALELALQSIPFRIIDSAPTRSDKSRALVIQPRTLELLARHGIAHEIVALGNVGTGARVFVNKKPAAELDLADLGFDDTAFPLPLWISQADTEHFLDAALRKYGCGVERPFTAESIEQDDTGATVTLRNGVDGSEETLRAKYVVGCDGAHSVVRYAAQLKFEGSAYPQDFLLAEMDEKLLDSYDLERRRVGEHLLKGTDRAFQFGSSGNPVFIFLRNFLVPWVIPWAFGDRSRRAKMFRFMSELGIRYRHSAIVGTASTYKGPLRGGDRAPDATLEGPDGPTSMLGLCTGPGHHLVLFSGTGSAAADDAVLQKFANGLGINTKLAKTHKIFSQKPPGSTGYLDRESLLHECYGFVEPGYVLMRPDEYVAHIGLLTAEDEFLIWLKGYMAL